jgi:hypothetical protein
MFEDDTGDVYGSIGLDRFVLFIGAAEIENAAGSRSSFGLGEIRGITVDGENHWAGGVANRVIGVGSGVIEEMIDVFECFGGYFSLCSGQGSDCYEHGAVDCSGIVQEAAQYLLKAFNLLCRQLRRCVGG